MYRSKHLFGVKRDRDLLLHYNNIIIKSIAIQTVLCTNSGVKFRNGSKKLLIPTFFLTKPNIRIVDTTVNR